MSTSHGNNTSNFEHGTGLSLEKSLPPTTMNAVVVMILDNIKDNYSLVMGPNSQLNSYSSHKIKVDNGSW